MAGGVSDFARRQLEKYGWKEGQGLGKKEDGMVSHIKVEKKSDDGGIGIEKVEKAQLEQTNVWWHDSFAGVLGNINVGSNKKKKKAKKSKKGCTVKNGGLTAPVTEESVVVSPPSFEELFKATGGARLGMRARRKQPGKLERADHIKAPSSNCDSGQSKGREDFGGEKDDEKKRARKEARKRRREDMIEREEAERKTCREKDGQADNSTSRNNITEDKSTKRQKYKEGTSAKKKTKKDKKRT